MNKPFMSILSLGQIMKQHLVAYLITLGSIAVIASVLLWFVPNQYTCTVTLLPERQKGYVCNGLNVLSPAAADLSNAYISVTNDAIYSDTYTELVQSSKVLFPIYDLPLQTLDQSYSGTLKQYLIETYDIETNQPEETDIRVLKELRDHIRVKIDSRTNLVYVSVTFMNKYIATAVAEQLVETLSQCVNAYHLEINTYYSENMPAPFTVIQPAILPIKHSSPHRLAILLLIELIAFIGLSLKWIVRDILSNKH